jgi:hypothetical protein
MSCTHLRRSAQDDLSPEMLKSSITSKDPAPVRDALKPVSGEALNVHVVTIDRDRYIVVLNPAKSRAIVYDVGLSSQETNLEAENIGFGKLGREGEWTLLNEEAEGQSFETHGGLWTLHRMGEVIRKKQDQRPRSACLFGGDWAFRVWAFFWPLPFAFSKSLVETWKM